MAREKKTTTDKPELRVVESPITTNDLNDEQKASLMAKGVTKLEALIKKKDEIVAGIRTQRKAMKSEGFERQEVDFALWLRKEGAEAANDRMELQVRIAKWLGSPLSFQATLDFGTGGGGEEQAPLH